MSFSIGANSANFNNCAKWNLQNGNLTSVGTNGGTSAYGTRDQSGNVWEWNEQTLQNSGTSVKCLRGGSWNSTLPVQLSSSIFLGSDPSTKSFNIGFRLVHFVLSSSFSSFVGIGDVGNNSDASTGRGGVDHEYHIMMNPVTNAEYVQFLNSVDPNGSNTYNLYSASMNSDARGGISFSSSRAIGDKYFLKTNMFDKPVVYVNWFCAARMANWLHNNFGDTESGVYYLNGANTGTNFSRNSSAKYAIASEDEWYKAAYYKAGGLSNTYWLYATQSDTNPTCVSATSAGVGPVINMAPSPTPSVTPTLTPSITPTQTPTPTVSYTPNTTPSPTVSVTPSLTQSVTPTITITPTITPSITVSQSLTPTVTRTVTPTNTPSISFSPTPTVTKTLTPTPTVTRTVTPTLTVTPTVTPTITPTPSTFSPPVGRSPQMILDGMYCIKTYLGNKTLSLTEPKYGDTTLSANTSEYRLWKNFIDNISSIYTTETLDGTVPTFWVVPSGNDYVANPTSSLNKLEPNKSYYFILKEYPEHPVAIPSYDYTALSQISCSQNDCPVFNISGINYDGIIIQNNNESYTPINIDLSGLNDNSNYRFRFESKDASAPCSIYPLFGPIKVRSDGTANIKAVLQFGFDSQFINQANLSQSFDRINNDIYTILNFSIFKDGVIQNNTANYGKRAIWNNQPGLTDVGSNGIASPYGISDMGGQLYEWTDTLSEHKPNHKILRGGSWADEDSMALSKYYHADHDIWSVFDEGGFGIRIGSYNNEYNYFGYSMVSNANNIADIDPKCSLGSVPYTYYVKTLLVSNIEYCNYLNTVDPEGTNKHSLYDYRMGRHHTGGISLSSCEPYGQKYLVKPLMHNKPVTFISWLNAAKYVNWLNSNMDQNSLYNGAYDLTNIQVDQTINRKQEAKYFLLSNNEWYKAAYFDAVQNSYFTYPTRSFIAPSPVSATVNGVGASATDICSTQFDNTFTVKCVSCNDLLSAQAAIQAQSANTQKTQLVSDNKYSAATSVPRFLPQCPKITSITSNVVLSASDGDSTLITAIVSGLIPDNYYSYNFESIDNNWPSNIVPLDGRFKAATATQKVSSLLTFSKEEDVSSTANNLPTISAITSDKSKIYNILKLNLNKDGDICDTTSRSALIRCNNCYDKDLITDIEFWSPPYNGTNSALLNGRMPEITVSGLGCEQYIPLVVDIKNYLPNKFLESQDYYDAIEKYTFSFGSHTPNISFFPQGGTAHISESGRITALAKLNGNLSATIYVNVTRDATGKTSTDYLGLRCAAACTPTPTKTVNIAILTPTPTRTPTQTRTQTPTPTITRTPRETPTITPTPTQTLPTPTPTPSFTPTLTPSITVSNTATLTPTITKTPVTPTPTPSTNNIVPPLMMGGSTAGSYVSLFNFNDTNVTYELQFSTDGGVAWDANTTTGNIAANTYSPNLLYVASGGYKWRVRTISPSISSWNTMNDYNYPNDNSVPPLMTGGSTSGSYVSLFNLNDSNKVCHIQYSTNNGITWIDHSINHYIAANTYSPSIVYVATSGYRWRVRVFSADLGIGMSDWNTMNNYQYPNTSQLVPPIIAGGRTAGSYVSVFNPNDTNISMAIDYSADNGITWISHSINNYIAANTYSPNIIYVATSGYKWRARAFSLTTGIDISDWNLDGTYQYPNNSGLLPPIISGGLSAGTYVSLHNPNSSTVMCQLQYSTNNGLAWIDSSFNNIVQANSSLNNITYVSTSGYIWRGRTISIGAGVDVSAWSNEVASTPTPTPTQTPTQTPTPTPTPTITRTPTLTPTPTVRQTLTVWALGNNIHGQLGDNTNISKSNLTKITNKQWNLIKAGDYHSAAIHNDGSLWTWGLNSDGQLGDGTTTNRSIPTLIDSSIWIDVALGSSHSLGIKSDGSLWAWGSDTYGQLGNGSGGTSTIPILISSDSWLKVSTSLTGYHSIAIKSDGSLWTWGLNNYGQLGDGTIINKSVPTLISGIGTVWRHISCGGSHTAAIKTDNTLWIWGLNSDGQLGDGTYTNKYLPTQIGNDTWNSIELGASHTLGLKNNGTFWTWGGNGNGQLGNGSTTGRNSPGQIGNLTGGTFSKFSAGRDHSLAIYVNNGYLVGWGYNGYGQIGPYQSFQSLTPITINTTPWSQVAAGGDHSLCLRY